MLYERTTHLEEARRDHPARAGNLRQDKVVSPDLLLKDPHVLDFLGLNDHYLEKNLEDAILRDLEQFLLEMGAGFTFVARRSGSDSTTTTSTWTSCSTTESSSAW